MDHGQCITEETLTEYLEGGLDPAVKTASEVHLIECDRCRERLAFFMRLLNPELTSEEAEALEAIKRQWDDRTPGTRLPGRPRIRRNWLLVCAAVAACLVIGVVTIRYVLEQGVPGSAGEVVDLLLASEPRPFESRISGQPHRALVRTRGPEDPGIAYGALAGEMTRLSADAHEMGRFYLLQKDFNRARSYLEVAEQEVGAGPDVHNDLGVAYLESGVEAQLEKAAEEFRHALSLDPDFAAAAFNLAIFYERTDKSFEAEAQWRSFLQLEPDASWTSEARLKLERIVR
jgi:tetratricopeptide (TPR) repeat protein